MLYHLRVKNLALIDSAEVEFGDGLNILTGETGAGKSIIIGSVQIAEVATTPAASTAPAGRVLVAPGPAPAETGGASR